MGSGFRELEIWKLGMEICEDTYRITNQFPKHEIYTLVSQMRRSAISVPSNIAEGFARRNKGEKYQFINISGASNAELETQLELSHRLGYIDDSSYSQLLEKIEKEGKMINGYVKLSCHLSILLSYRKDCHGLPTYRRAQNDPADGARFCAEGTCA